MTKSPNLPYDPGESITYWILNAAHRLEHLLNLELRPLKMTLRQAEVLVVLALDGELSQSALAKRLGIEPPTLAGIVSRMEEAGWIARGACPNDRRKKLIQLTDQVPQIWPRMIECAQSVRQQASRGLTAEQLATLHALLDRVHDNVEAALDVCGNARGTNGNGRSRRRTVRARRGG